MRYILTAILCLFFFSSQAQKNQLACPVKVSRKAKKHREPETQHIMFGTGWQYALPYNKSGLNKKDYYQFTALPRPYTDVLFYQPLSGPLGLIVGLQLGFCNYGLKTTETTYSGRSRERAFLEVVQVRLPLGITYQVSNGFHVALTPALVYATQYDTYWEYSQSGSGGGLQTYSDWETDPRKNMVYLALDLRLMQRLYKHFHLGAHFSADNRSLFYLTASNSVLLDGGGIMQYTRTIQPKMLYAGLELAYRF